jgi:alkyl hydroperoxide reductase subunit D
MAMEFIKSLQERVPDYAKDMRLNLDGVLARSPLPEDEALGCALAASFAAKNRELVALFRAHMTPEDANGALTAASIMGMTNVWYSYMEQSDDGELQKLPPELRMNAYAAHGGVSKRKFEMWALAASLVGKCHFCISNHVAMLKKDGMSASDLKQVGRIAATINSIALTLNAEG